MNFESIVNNHENNLIKLEEYNNTNLLHFIKTYNKLNNIDLDASKYNKKKLINYIESNNIPYTEYSLVITGQKNNMNKDIINKLNVYKYSKDGPLQKKLINKYEEHKNLYSGLAPYINKQFKMETVNLLPHQKKFVKSFIYSNLRGCIAFHGVGSGKTLTAVVSSYLYLRTYPNNKVIVISPPALIFNFINSMQQYGLDIKDNRYNFYTYNKYIKSGISGDDALVIIDEAHNLRSELKIKSVEDPENPSNVMEYPSSNSRMFHIMRKASEKCHKIILLTGTMFVNKLYDSENLLALIDNRYPNTLKTFSLVIENNNTLQDYFNYRISYFGNTDKNEFFPEINEQIIPIYINNDSAENYLKLKKNKKLNAFYSAEVKSTFGEHTLYNYSDDEEIKNIRLKNNFILEIIKEKTNEKFIIYSTLYSEGVKKLSTEFTNDDELKNEIVFITGKQNAVQKENSKKLFNMYSFDKNEPIGKRILLITKAGSEGVDTVNCENVIIMNSLWNDSAAEQIIARAVRFKSHEKLKEIRGSNYKPIVNVYRLLLALPNNIPTIDFITNSLKNKIKNAFINFNRESSALAKIQHDLYQQYNNRIYNSKKTNLKSDNNINLSLLYNETIKELHDILKKLKTPEGKPFVNNDTEYKKVRPGYGKKMIIVQDGRDGFDKVDDLKNNEDKFNWYINMIGLYHYTYPSNEYKEKYDIKDSKLNDKVTENYKDTCTSDIILYIMSKTKTDNFIDFIENIMDERIKQFEMYQSKFIKKLINDNKYNLFKNSDNDIDFYKEYNENFKDEIEELKKIDEYINTEDIKKQGRTRGEKFQQYFTPDNLSDIAISKLEIKNINNSPLYILEPTAGEGNIIDRLIYNENFKKNLPIYIDYVEYDSINREILNRKYNNKNFIRKQNQINFLLFNSGIKYDYIIMNPPFNLRKSENKFLLKDVKDYDFIIRAFSMLKTGGTLVAIMSDRYGNILYKELDNLKNVKNYKITPPKSYKFLNKGLSENNEGKEEFTRVKIIILTLIKKLENEGYDKNEDDKILQTKFYIKQGVEGQEILNNELSIDQSINDDKINDYKKNRRS